MPLKVLIRTEMNKIRRNLSQVPKAQSCSKGALIIGLPFKLNPEPLKLVLKELGYFS